MPTKQIALRLDEELLRYLEDRANREHRTLSNMIISILLDAMEHGGFVFPEVPRTNDLINRGDAIEAVNERIMQIGYDNETLVLSIRQAIRDVPRVIL